MTIKYQKVGQNRWVDGSRLKLTPQEPLNSTKSDNLDVCQYCYFCVGDVIVDKSRGSR
jgi:hypothetical protein